MNSSNDISKPEINIRVGSVRASVWNRIQPRRDGIIFEMKRVVLERIYKNADGEWKSTNSFDVNDVPKAILALSKAYSHIYGQNAAIEAIPLTLEDLQRDIEVVARNPATDRSSPRQGPVST